MIILIFFGGILMGFLLGFSSMAALAARSYRLDAEELEEVPIYPQPNLPQSHPLVRPSMASVSEEPYQEVNRTARRSKVPSLQPEQPSLL